MNTENTSEKTVPMLQLVRSIQARIEPEAKTTVYRFDIFKGSVDEEGLVSKVKSVGSAYVREGMKTYTVAIKTFLLEKYFLLSNTKPGRSDADYVILTREPARILGRKYFWNNVGEGRLMDGPNHGLLKLNWDIFGADLYMNLNPINVTETTAEAEKADEAA